MTALTEVIRRHEAAIALGTLPSTTYRAGGLMSAARWADHQRHLQRSRGVDLAYSRNWKLIDECGEMAALAVNYGVVGRVIEVIESETQP